jgi:hypothetical protein
MSVQSYFPAYPDLQTLSASFNTSGVATVVSKFRYIKGVQVQPIFTNSTLNLLGVSYDISVVVTNNPGTVALQLLNASTQVSSNGNAVNVWLTGQM